MFDARKLLEQFLGAQVPGMSGSVRDKAGQAADLAKRIHWRPEPLQPPYSAPRPGANWRAMWPRLAVSRQLPDWDIWPTKL